MAYISFQPSDFFSPKLYTGTEAELAVTGAGFQPDLVWLKCREATESQLWFDSVRGATKYIESNDTPASTTNAESLKSFDSDGFTLGTMVGSNKSGNTYASWNWKAGTTSGIAGSPSITPSSYSFNATSGISIVTYTGNSGGGVTVPHGLGAVPNMVIVKKLNATSSWFVYHSALDPTAPENYHLVLNTNAARVSSVAGWYNTAPTSLYVTMGADNNDVNTYIMYAFTPIKGYSKFGSYIGTSNSDGPFVYTGFRPAFVMLKDLYTGGTSYEWYIFDNKRSTSGGFNKVNYTLEANENAAEDTNAGNYLIDILSNGFKIRDNNSGINSSSDEYIYMAFAESPLVSSNSKPTTAY